MTGRPTVAVIGAGVSGLTAAYLLRDTHDVALFEREPRLGGHAHTHDVPIGPDTACVDSGFIVLNDRTYPLLTRLFSELGIEVTRTEMSMGISCDGCGLSYVGGRGAAGIFAQRSRLADPTMWRLLISIRRFQRLALAELGDVTRTGPGSLETFGGFLDRHGFDAHFVQHYAVPVVSCVWSSGQADALEYPAAYLFEFLAHHGFLRLGDAPQWYVVRGGSRAYVDEIRHRLPDVRLTSAVTGVTRKTDRVLVEDAAGAQHEFDRVVIATHADEALALLTDPSADEFSVLGAFAYAANTTQLHRDAGVLATRTAERASWNFHLDACDQRSEQVQVSYWMNRLQGHPDEHPLIVTLNRTDRVSADAVIREMTYTHPVYTPASVAAQRRLAGLNTDRVVYAGAYHGWGFHEDGCRSGVEAAAHFGASW